MIEDNNFIKHTWKSIEQESNWKDFILPKRTDKKFWQEGELEAEHIQKIIGSENLKVLDFGCGIGRVLINIKAKELHGADASSKFLNEMKLDINIHTYYSDGLSIIKDVDYFDFIYSIMVFQHNNKIYHGDILKNLFRILKTNGRIYIQFPQKPNEYYIETTFVNLYEKDELIRLFQSAGFSNISITEGNLVGYGENGEYKPKGNLEYFVTAEKK